MQNSWRYSGAAPLTHQSPDLSPTDDQNLKRVNTVHHQTYMDVLEEYRSANMSPAKCRRSVTQLAVIEANRQNTSSVKIKAAHISRAVLKMESLFKKPLCTDVLRP